MQYLYMLFGAFFAPVIHEWTRAVTSTVLGDPTPRNNGFKTFNPIKFSEPIGFILTLVFGFGWGRPIPISYAYYKNRKQGVLLVNILPSVVNLLIGIIAILIARTIDIPLSQWGFNNGTTGIAGGIFWSIFFFGSFNVGIAIFNLIPVYPLDMQKILLYFSSPTTIQHITHYEKPMQIVLIVLLVFGLMNYILVPIRDGIIFLIPSL